MELAVEITIKFDLETSMNQLSKLILLMKSICIAFEGVQERRGKEKKKSLLEEDS